MVARAKTESERIAIEIGQALAGDAWHGPSLEKLFAGVTAKDAAERPIASAHTIWELVLHITAWSNIVRRRLTGGKVEPKRGENWPRPGKVTEKNWKSARAALFESHERLLEVVAGLTDEELLANAPRSRRSVSNMLHGLTQHDAYHGGQIALLKKALRSNHRNQS